MNPKNGFPHIVIGTVLFIIGGFLAYSFYDYDMGLITATFWDSVIIFSVISFIGLLLLIYGISKVSGNRHR